jgi:DNA-binding CsgD family transcriptional regulator
LDEIVAECRGNPLALVELPRAWAVPDMAGGFASPDTVLLPFRLEQSFLRRLETLPGPTRSLLLLAAAEPLGDPALLWRAAAGIGIPADAVGSAEAADLVEFGTRVRFRHPLVRSTVYRAALPDDRRRAHQALARATDPDRDPDRHAWHRAQGTVGTDETVAVDLERSAERAQARGGLAAAAAFLERAAGLTSDPSRRAGRALAAAQAKQRAGAAGGAAALLAIAQTGPLDDLQRARVDLIRGQLAFGSSHGRDAPSLLLSAARQFATLDPARAGETYLDALAAALFVGRLAGEVSLREVAVAAQGATRSSTRPPDLLLRGLGATIADGYAVGAPLLEQAVAAFRAGSVSPAEAVRWLWLATHAAHDRWDDEGWGVLCEQHLRLARAAGALAVLPLALSARIGLHLFAGELQVAASLLSEVAAVTAATGSQLPPYAALALAAFRGREDEASVLIDGALDDVRRRGDGMGLTLIQHAQAVLYNGLGRYDEAMSAAEQGASHLEELAFANWSLVQLVEAAVRAGQRSRAADALNRLRPIVSACGTEWALGVEARARALLSEGTNADNAYREAIERLRRTHLGWELARAKLLYGEWLRREGRRVDARDQLRTALAAFSVMGAEAYAERARRELAATGATMRTRTVEATTELTPQEGQIARLAVAGRTNVEIGAELFLSPRTVEWHLRKVFAKLGVSSRRHLGQALVQAGGFVSSTEFLIDLGSAATRRGAR